MDHPSESYPDYSPDIFHHTQQNSQAAVQIVSVNLNGTRFPADIVSKKDFDFMRQDGDIGSMDYDQAVKNGEIFFGWSMWMEQDGYAPGESIAFDF